MYPFGSLPANLIAFAAFLRSEHGFHIGAAEVRDAARALDVIDLADEGAVRNALRPIFSRTRSDADGFDRAFDAFFYPGPPGVTQRESLFLPRRRDRHDVEGEARGRGDGHADEDEQGERDGVEGPSGRVEPIATSEAESAAQRVMLRASYSPFDADTAVDTPELGPVEPEWRDAARSLVYRLYLGLSRRWRPSARGRRFDLRRTLRSSVQTGGEPLTARWLLRPRRAPRLVIVIDGSRSMSGFAQPALNIAVAIATVTMRVEVFTFSTALQRVTGEVRRAAVGGRRHLTAVARAWGGGTSIGASLRELLRRFGGALITRDTVVIIASDGLDVGDPLSLRDAVRELHRRAAAVIWLNPLIETPGYEPTASGMRAARPYITTFASVTDPAGLLRLAHVVRVRP